MRIMPVTVTALDVADIPTLAACGGESYDGMPSARRSGR